MKMSYTLVGADAMIKTLQALPAEVVSKRGGPVKSALRKSASKLRGYMATALKTAIDEDGSQSSGLLLSALVATRGKQPTGAKGERYLVRVKNKPYVGGTLRSTRKNKGAAKRGTTLQTANLMEYGSEHQKARPWMRPTGAAHGSEIIGYGTAELKTQIDKVVATLQKNGGTV
jgi:hypothetical protein